MLRISVSYCAVITDESALFCRLYTGLAVDYFNERLYWADAKLSVIGSVRLDGSDPVIAVSGIKNS